MPTYKILLSAPYMLPFVERFRPVFAHYNCELIIPQVNERLEAPEILQYAGQFDGTVCGDDRYTRPRSSGQCSPRLKVISKWGTGIDSINQPAAAELGVKVCRTTNAFNRPGLRQRDGLHAGFRAPPALDGPRGQIRPVGETARTRAERMRAGRDRCRQHRPRGAAQGGAPSA